MNKSKTKKTINENMMANNNNTTTIPVFSENGHIHTDVEVILVISAGIILSLVIIIGNLLVIMAYKLTPPLQTITNLFIFSMAISDFLIGIISVNFYVVYVALHQWRFGANMCQIWNCLDYVLCQVSGTHLIVICLDRYFSVKYPLKYRLYRTRSRSYIALFAVWLIAILIWLPIIVGYPYIVGGSTVPNSQCYVQFTKDSVPTTIVTAAMAFYIPVLIISIAYVRIFMIIRQRNIDFIQNVQQHVRPPKDSVDRRNALDDPQYMFTALRYQSLLDEKKAAKNLALIFLNFFISLLPYHILVVLKPAYTGQIPVLMWNFAYILVYVNSAINPLCYTIIHKRFRRAMFKILKRLKDNMKK